MNRVIPGLLMATCCYALLFWGSPLLVWIGMVVCAALALHEFFRMTCNFLGPVRHTLALLGCLLPLVAVYNGTHEFFALGLLASLFVIIVLALQGYGQVTDVFRFLACGGLAGLYISGCLATLVLIRAYPHGMEWLMLLFAMVAGSDTGAYYAGKTWGKRKLFPLISPHKTVAGGVGGLVAGIVVAELINWLLPHSAPFWPLFCASGLTIVVGMCGDLTESLIKRSVQVKDSGTILRGHGGLLDRIDSLLLAGPVLYSLLFFGLLQ